MRVLALETATPVASVALIEAAGVVASRATHAPMRHLEWLAAAIEGVLHDAGWGPRDIDAVAVGRGPGGFTGLRIGIATAAAWAQARGVPVLGVGTLEALAHASAAGAEGLVLAVLDAHRGEIAGALYRLPRTSVPPASLSAAGDAEPVCLVPPVVAAPQVLAAEVRPVLDSADFARRPLVLAGDGLVRHGEALVAALARDGGPGPSVVARPDVSPCAESVGLLARPRLLRGARDEAAGLLPLYGRRPAARLWQETQGPPGSGG